MRDDKSTEARFPIMLNSQQVLLIVRNYTRPFLTHTI